jgi:hypothetical protein
MSTPTPKQKVDKICDQIQQDGAKYRRALADRGKCQHPSDHLNAMKTPFLLGSGSGRFRLASRVTKKAFPLGKTLQIKFRMYCYEIWTELPKTICKGNKFTIHYEIICKTKVISKN